MNKNSLNWIVGTLSGVEYQITGGFAANLHGSGREVDLIDISNLEIKTSELGAD